MNSSPAHAPPPGARPAVESSSGQPMFDLIELLFFAYRDFVGDADRLLESYQFGRAHHRILHFVNRQPGLTIAELLDILSITKQSLNRVLKELVEKDFIVVRPGESDRRQRHLFATEQGSELAGELAQLQSRRLTGALESMSSQERPGLRQDMERERGAAVAFLLGVINDSERAKVRALIWGSDGAAEEKI